MKLLIDLGNQLIAEAVYQFLVTDSTDEVVMAGDVPVQGFSPQVVLVDAATVRHALEYREARVLLIDTGMETGKLLSLLMSYDLQGVVSTTMGLSLLRKALTAVSQGELWIDSNALKAVLEDNDVLSRKGTIKGMTQRHQEIIDCVCQGLSNKEIGDTLGVSSDTVKAHLNRIFRRLHISSREQLMALMLDRPDHALARTA